MALDGFVTKTSGNGRGEMRYENKRVVKYAARKRRRAAARRAERAAKSAA